MNRAGDKLTRHASATTAAGTTTQAAKTRASVNFENLAVNAEASPVGLRLDGVEAVPVLGNPDTTEDLWTIIHNMNIFGTNYEK